MNPTQPDPITQFAKQFLIGPFMVTTYPGGESFLYAKNAHRHTLSVRAGLKEGSAYELVTSFGHPRDALEHIRWHVCGRRDDWKRELGWWFAEKYREQIRAARTDPDCPVAPEKFAIQNMRKQGIIIGYREKIVEGA